MTLKKLIKNYLIIVGRSGLKNEIKKCQCDLSNLMHCMTPDRNCEIIEKGE